MDVEEPKSFIDFVEAYMNIKKMPADLHQISTGNKITVIDTPRVWGSEMTEKGVSKAAADAVAEFAGMIASLLAKAEHTIDIVSLDAPNGTFWDAIRQGLQAHAERDQPLLVRFLFGFIPFEGKVEKFVDTLAKFRQQELPTGKVTMVVGQYYTKLEGWWNHAKIIAVDGHTAIVGGHNLFPDAYAGYPPVHDLSLKVTGPAAADAHRFAEFIWARGGYYLDAWQITGKTYAKLKDGEKRDRLTVPKQTPRWEVDEPDVEQPRESKGGQGSKPEKRKGGHGNRVMAVGRAGGLEKSSLNASDLAKQYVIKHAQKTLRICQQDLLFLSSTKLANHQVCHWIAEALIASPGLQVQIVVSPIDGSGGGQQYSWGSGAIGTYRALQKILLKKLAEQAHAIPDAFPQALQRLQVAPFCFTDVKFTAEGEDYKWPDVPEKLQAFRFNPRNSLVRQNPNNKKPPAPGNHAKFYLADDSVYYVGSDNLYPHNLAEFGYLVEGDSVADLRKNYWDHVWKYSSPHVVTEETLEQRLSDGVVREHEREVAERTDELEEEADEIFPL